MAFRNRFSKIRASIYKKKNDVYNVEKQSIKMLRTHSSNNIDQEGNNALHLAVIEGDYDSVKKICSYHRNIDLPNNEGNDALMLAVIHKHETIANYLLSIGAQTCTRNKHGLTASDLVDKNTSKTLVNLISLNMRNAKCRKDSSTQSYDTLERQDLTKENPSANNNDIVDNTRNSVGRNAEKYPVNEADLENETSSETDNQRFSSDVRKIYLKSKYNEVYKTETFRLNKDLENKQPQSQISQRLNFDSSLQGFYKVQSDPNILFENYSDYVEQSTQTDLIERYTHTERIAQSTQTNEIAQSIQKSRFAQSSQTNRISRFTQTDKIEQSTQTDGFAQSSHAERLLSHSDKNEESTCSDSLSKDFYNITCWLAICLLNLLTNNNAILQSGLTEVNIQSSKPNINLQSQINCTKKTFLHDTTIDQNNENNTTFSLFDEPDNLSNEQEHSDLAALVLQSADQSYIKVPAPGKSQRAFNVKRSVSSIEKVEHPKELQRDAKKQACSLDKICEMAPEDDKQKMSKSCPDISFYYTTVNINGKDSKIAMDGSKLNINKEAYSSHE
ncbi:ankyrin repeat domain-containing protein 18B-like [Biomphalaria glabrata]|uniref:Ankyrin repeat domain-containing protein 18B-like n=1 Tax=Biomphalaria glabrata TaxID=6526 RepID=A0A9W2YH12_BIOGL|nr:ankyrin repeat domain-containing protein 18B-like [Biomphalaria glabrata]XP_055862016.1 ankyrin repeat domain-containing protein 18B-like [Biomphalaria glabrata]XP_055862017.1 ankyrin repeat domain-containing protein 18B-like [Biomphalaria glabrata]XP_055862018.1 ankyrin repeat domain-containing protein 18B-like [Biomphalaria glabrata]